jgi:hypothetical protein
MATARQDVAHDAALLFMEWVHQLVERTVQEQLKAAPQSPPNTEQALDVHPGRTAIRD